MDDKQPNTDLLNPLFSTSFFKHPNESEILVAGIFNMGGSKGFLIVSEKGIPQKLFEMFTTLSEPYAATTFFNSNLVKLLR